MPSTIESASEMLGTIMLSQSRDLATVIKTTPKSVVNLYTSTSPQRYDENRKRGNNGDREKR